MRDWECCEPERTDQVFKIHRTRLLKSDLSPTNTYQKMNIHLKF